MPAQLAGGAAVLALAAAAVLLLLVVRPNLGGRPAPSAEGFPRWAQLSEDDLTNAMREDTRATRVSSRSTIAVRKFERLDRAIEFYARRLPKD
nr:Pycsar system effector family protein [Kutzneria buriramensis]WKX16030.1 DUF5706 domain-containing protein [Kutzneria buriramensis]